MWDVGWLKAMQPDHGAGCAALIGSRICVAWIVTTFYVILLICGLFIAYYGIRRFWAAGSGKGQSGEGQGLADLMS